MWKHSGATTAETVVEAVSYIRRAKDGYCERPPLLQLCSSPGTPEPIIPIPIHPMTKRYLVPLAAAVLTAGSASAQRSIVPGEVTRGSLSTSDPRDAGKHYDDYVFAGRRGETVIVNMESRSFDTYVYLGTLRRGMFQEIGRDDDGGNGTNSRLEVRLPEDGTYVIRASSLGMSTGPYTLTLSGGRATSDVGWNEPPPPDPIYDRPGTGFEPRNGGPIVAGDRIRGRLSSTDPTLDNGAAYHLYTYQGRRGERLTITLRSTDFDGILVLGTRGGRHGIGGVLTRDDDSGGGRDARIDYTLPNDGEFVIRVNPLLPSNGTYTLEMESSLGGSRPRPDPVYDDPDDEEFDDDVVDRRLVGRWGLTMPGARVEPDDWSSVSANARMGILNIDDSGAYTWRKGGRVLRGQLVPFTPRRNALPGVRYYSINDGREEFYLFFNDDEGEPYMQVNNRRTNAVVAYGYREGGTY